MRQRRIGDLEISTDDLNRGGSVTDSSEAT